MWVKDTWYPGAGVAVVTAVDKDGIVECLHNKKLDSKSSCQADRLVPVDDSARVKVGARVRWLQNNHHVEAGVVDLVDESDNMAHVEYFGINRWVRLHKLHVIEDAPVNVKGVASDGAAIVGVATSKTTFTNTKYATQAELSNAAFLPVVAHAASQAIIADRYKRIEALFREHDWLSPSKPVWHPTQLDGYMGARHLDFDGNITVTEVKTRSTVDAKPCLRERLARAFGLSPDASDDIVEATACKAWDGVSDRATRLDVELRALRADYAVERQRALGLADVCGEQTTTNGWLETENRDLLAENARLRRRLDK